MSVVTIYATKDQLKNLGDLTDEAVKELVKKPQTRQYYEIKYVANAGTLEGDGKLINILAEGLAANDSFKIRYRLIESSPAQGGQGKKKRRRTTAKKRK